MSLFEGIKTPETANAKAVKNYMEAFQTKDAAIFRKELADDIVFDGLLFKIDGIEAFVEQAKGFAELVESMKIEAITECADADHYLVIFWKKCKGAPEADSVCACDYFTLKDGKIQRINNVFDVDKMPQIKSFRNRQISYEFC